MALLFVFSMTPQPARAQDYPDTGDDIDQVVARISFIQGPVSYARGDDPDEWDPAAVNVPFALGDRLYSAADGRAELSLPGGNFVRIGRRSYVSALTLSYDTKQFYVGNGAATFTVRRLGPDEIFEIDTPSVAVTVDQPGRYRVEVDENGDTRVIVRSGVAFVAANGRQVTVERAEMRIYGLDATEYEILGLRQVDTFDSWVDERQARFDTRYRNAYQYADEEIVGMDDLADNGRWEEIPDYGYAWTPTVVAVGWQPFTVGHWFWQDPWGWSWISEEPWGWAPSHYGRWTFYRSRWYWVPVRRRVEVVRYAPAIVGFVSVRGNIGWFPLHPRDRFVPWWGRRERVVENVTFVNRTRIVLVDERTFVSSRRVTTAIIRDQTIIREATTVRLDRRLPVPQRESIRVTAERRQVERPSAAIISRQVVVRNAPTPPPPRFDEKVRVIRERQGQPLTTREIVDMGAKDFKSNRRIQIRTAGESKGNFTARGGQGGQAVQPQPLAPLKGRSLATPDNPVSTDVSRRQQREQQKDERQIQQQQQKDQKQQERDLQKQQQEQKKQERDQDQLQKKQERELQKDQKQLQDQQQRKDQQLQQKDLERKQQEQDRLQKKQERDQDQLLKKQERDQEKDRKQLQDQQRKDQELQRKDLERKQQDQDQLQKKQERDREKDQKQLQDQQRKDQELQRKDLERKQQEQDRLQKQQQQDQERKNQQLQQQQRKDQQQLQQDQKKQEQDQRRQDLERQRLEKQQQDKQGRDLERERQQQLRDEQLQQKKLQEQQRKGPPPDDRKPPAKERKDQDAPPPPPPGPPPGPPPR
jgi:hypothetical protein